VRPVVFHPKARDAIRRFSKEARVRLGKDLFRLQMGERISMPVSRPMPAVSAGVAELRVKGRDGIFRVF
jgi:phage-related protein